MLWLCSREGFESLNSVFSPFSRFCNAVHSETKSVTRKRAVGGGNLAIAFAVEESAAV